jgi:PPOX class probable FMN-dependent enzyme
MTEPIETVEQLRARYKEPGTRAVKKQLARLDQHCRRFIELSPFVVVASSSGTALDCSPRGGAPGFVTVVDDVTLHIPDSAGNNRLDSLANIVTTGRIGLLFLIPGIDETLRVNGAARLFATPEKPRTIIEVAVEEAYLHCAKALMRSRLWAPESRQPRDVLPPMGKMINDQTGDEGPVETQEQMVARYTPDL